ncbi:uncharacterized protein B0H64DRAFT_409476 [Chaetomium fimeti]|uniref:F-box domain-containing protein n=1 Tax=Chaetomium fimeti TaxID=1854472 RepID=A0AAE0H7X7_9PEZI|nr:hypothetical protein B0H64DRAFT_409476 [Chaetomium fimeti]
MFWKLPREVFDLVVSGLPHNDQVALSTVSKGLRAALATVIWNRIRVDVQRRGTDQSQPRVNSEAVTRCAIAFRQPSAAIRQVTQLELLCGFGTRHYLGTPCPHPRPPPQGGQRGQHLIRLTKAHAKHVADIHAERQDHYNCVVENTISIIESLYEGQLQEFSWDLCTCVPPALLETLAKRHRHLASLRLTTDYMCPGPPGDENKVVDFSPFRHLKRISWKGLPSHNACQLREALRNNSHHLEELELDLYKAYPKIFPHPGRWKGEAYCLDFWRGMPFDTRFRDDILSMKTRQSSKPAFPSLRVLKLRSAPLDLENATRALCRVIDFAALESLTLWYCCGWEVFLDTVQESTGTKPIKLRTLEVKCTEDRGEYADIARFVGSFQGLSDLFVSLSGEDFREPDPDLWIALPQHRVTLKRLVFHSRFTPGMRVDYYCDCTNLGLPRLDPTFNPMSDLDLECLGLSCDPDLLPPLLRPFTAKSTLKIFHLRQTGADLNRGERCRALDLPQIDEPDCQPEEHNRVTTLRSLPYDTLEDALQDSFRALLDWAFGPHGIASIQLVAFGDFAQGRNKLYLHNLFVCRAESRVDKGGPPYRVFDARDRKHEHEWATIVRPHWSFLEACPVGSFQSDSYYRF